MKVTLTLLTILISSFLPVAAQKSGPSKNEAAITSVALKWQEAWNRHDVNAMAALLTEDVDFVTLSGARHKGRQEFKDRYTKSHEMLFKDSNWTTDKTEVKFIRSDVGIAHVEWSMKVDKYADGTSREPRQGIFTWALQKRHGKWLIRASQNTNIGQPQPVEPCPAALKPYVRTTLYLGTSRYFQNGGWQGFIEEVIVKHLPAGGTVIENNSGWWRRPDGSTAMGGGRMLIVLAPMTEIATHRTGIQSVIAEIKRVTGHLSVGWEEARLCAGF